MTRLLSLDPVSVFTVSSAFHLPFIEFIRTGETDVVWQFKDENDFDNWKVTNDSDHNEGQSFSSFESSQAGHALFSGNVQSKTPLDGRIKRSGYCNIQSLRARVIFTTFPKM